MDLKKILLSCVFVVSVLLLWDRYQAQEAGSLSTTKASVADSRLTGDVPDRPALATTELPAAAAATAPTGSLASGERLTVATDVFEADIDSNGGDLRRVVLLRHREAGVGGKPLTLLDDGPRPYVAQSGLIGADMPNHRSSFEPEPGQLKLADEAAAVELALRHASDTLDVRKVYTFRRDEYVVNVRFEVTNRGTQVVDTAGYFHVLRDGLSPDGESWLQHTYTGPVVYTAADKFRKIDFDSVRSGKADYARQARDGWVALIQHYFLSAWLPKAGALREYYIDALPDGLYRAGVKTPAVRIEPGATETIAMDLYIGPQEQDRLAELADGLDLVTDYGWLTIIAKPLFWLLSLFNDWTDNWGLAIILLTLLVKAVFYPLSAASYRSMAKMRVLAPKLQALKERFGDDKQRMQVEMMNLYKTEKINPLGGCLPILVQIPVFIALYYALIASVELRHAPFYGWITDLSAPDPYYILPVLMGISMIVQTRLNPTPPDPIQARIMQIMPIVFSVFFFFFAAGLVLYWLVNNVISIAQQWRMNVVMEREKANPRR